MSLFSFLVSRVVFLLGSFVYLAYSYSIEDATSGTNLRKVDDRNSVTVTSSNPQGVDISQQLTSDSAECMAQNGVKFIVPRGYCSSCKVDTAVCNSLKTAANAGIPTYAQKESSIFFVCSLDMAKKSCKLPCHPYICKPLVVGSRASQLHWFWM